MIQEAVDILSSADRLKLVEDNIGMLHKIASRLKRRYWWVPAEDCYSYAGLGLVMASKRYDPARGTKFASYAHTRAYFAAVDRMREERVVLQKGRLDVSFVSLIEEPPCAHSYYTTARVEDEDLLQTLLKRVRYEDRCLLIMHYVEGKSFEEIAVILRVSESTTRNRHERLLNWFRQRVGGEELVVGVRRRRDEARSRKSNRRST